MCGAPLRAVVTACMPACQVIRACCANCSSTRCGQSKALLAVAQRMPRQISVQRATAWSNTSSGLPTRGRQMIATV